MGGVRGRPGYEAPLTEIAFCSQWGLRNSLPSFLCGDTAGSRTSSDLVLRGCQPDGILILTSHLLTTVLGVVSRGFQGVGHSDQGRQFLSFSLFINGSMVSEEYSPSGLWDCLSWGLASAVSLVMRSHHGSQVPLSLPPCCPGTEAAGLCCCAWLAAACSWLWFKCYRLWGCVHMCYSSHGEVGGVGLGIELGAIGHGGRCCNPSAISPPVLL